jgi:hypothetical protein
MGTLSRLSEWTRMHKDKRERFKELCELAEVQEDTKKLGKIAEEIDSILDAELVRLKKLPLKNTKPLT